MINQILDSYNASNFVDINLNLMRANQTLADLTSLAVRELGKIFSYLNPKAIIVQGDTTSSYAASLSAFYQKIPVFHVEAGLRTNDIYSPYPEEFNRMSIDDISTLLFAPTSLAANNLIKENKNISKIFITGNTIVDSLNTILKTTIMPIYIKELLDISKSRCKTKEICKIILLTCHRRENYFQPIVNILKAVQELLKNFENIIIILPYHLNPNVRQSIKNGLPKEVYYDIINKKIIMNKKYLYLNRLIIIQPLNYIELVHLEYSSYFIMTDSGGIQEEGLSLGKPILILRENTERMEAVILGSAILVGTSPEKIIHFSSSLLKNETLYRKMSKPQTIYGNGNSGKIITNLIERYFENKMPTSSLNITISNISDYINILYQFDDYTLLNCENKYDIVIILTVWKRNNLEEQLIQVKRQSILKNKKTNIIIFQNYHHISITDIIEKWKKPKMFKDQVDITFIQSPFETGYFGRFLAPLTSLVKENAYFIICDDDVIWGDRYFENMIRVVNEGSLATRNGRLIDDNFNEFIPDEISKPGFEICFNEDIEYDFGGHIWAGRISWLRNAWRHIPISIENSEDFWISAVLESFYNISTKSPKCPCPSGNNTIIPDLCAASHISAVRHIDCIIGNSTINHFIRTRIMKETAILYNYKLLIKRNNNTIENMKKKYFFGNKSSPFFNLTDELWKNVLYWQ
jgi:UDP-N-acetylglucosamine 2-epimerase